LAIIEVLNPEKTSFRPSKWPQKFRNRKTAKNSKLPEDCFEPVGIGGWPPISTWIMGPGTQNPVGHNSYLLKAQQKDMLYVKKGTHSTIARALGEGKSPRVFPHEIPLLHC
jgi:hypothetical protein